MERSWLRVLVILALIYESSLRCVDRTPPGTFSKSRNRNDVGRYIIDIPGNPKNYTPNTQYNISVKLNPFHPSQHLTFKNFILTLDQVPNESLDDSGIVYSTGHFEFGSDTLAKFSDTCPNTVIEANSLPKREVQIFWIAPPKNSGCVAIKATVFESRDNWFSEDGPLTKILCEEPAENENEQPPILKHCCACDEAKYEVAFEGMWTRNTHPKDFPSDVWSTKFSDVIGASHKLDASFWKYTDIASEGLKELAELGDSKTLESELKELSRNIRTIIKARGLQYPNITSKTYAVFRVDNENHLVSLVSKITPSPDWIVGVANLELCRPGCTWEESRVLNLYPYDVGTDDGVSYTSPDSPSVIRSPIKKIKSNSPNDPRSPFYDENGEDMKPIARLHFTRLRLYEKTCDFVYSESDTIDESDPCAVTQWDEWSACTSQCGPGKMYTQRQYLNPGNAPDCNKVLVKERDCYGTSRHCRNGEYTEEQGNDLNEDKCELSDWGEWSSCSVSCGKGTRTRSKKLKSAINPRQCGLDIFDLQENEECTGSEDCDDYTEPEVGTNCPKTKWEAWTECNVTCGTGYKVRHRIQDDNDEDADASCATQVFEEVVKCYEPRCDEDDESKYGGLHPSNHLHDGVVYQAPFGPVVDCVVSKWSSWGPCEIPGRSCGSGFKIREREIKVHAANGGTPCPKRLVQKQRCYVACSEEDERQTQATWGPSNPKSRIDAVLDELYEAEGGNECIMSRWSKWSPCSRNCGGSSYQIRTRTILRKPPGVACGERIQERACALPLACTGS